ncbi:MAG: transcriptional repressor [Bacteroidota bacterium]
MGIKRQTKSVSTILRLFEKEHHALSVVELVERFKKEMNKSTVYRILERLEQEGIIHSFRGNDGLTWYAKCTDCNTGEHLDHHPHFQCRDCGKVECIPVSIKIPAVAKHKIESAQVLLTGQCADCLNAEAAT